MPDPYVYLSYYHECRKLFYLLRGTISPVDQGEKEITNTLIQFVVPSTVLVKRFLKKYSDLSYSLIRLSSRKMHQIALTIHYTLKYSL